MIDSMDGARAYWEGQVSDSRTWINASVRWMAAAKAVYELAEQMCEGVFEAHSLADRHPSKKETILGLLGAYELQASLAVENALKGLQVAIDTKNRLSVFTADGEVAKRYRTHRAIKIAEACSIDLSAILKHLLDHCTASVEWGKYGIALNVEAHLFTRCEPYDCKEVLEQFVSDVHRWHDAVVDGSMSPNVPRTPSPHGYPTQTITVEEIFVQAKASRDSTANKAEA